MKYTGSTSNGTIAREERTLASHTHSLVVELVREGSLPRHKTTPCRSECAWTRTSQHIEYSCSMRITRLTGARRTSRFSKHFCPSRQPFAKSYAFWSSEGRYRSLR